jgi:hypothetical protein
MRYREEKKILLQIKNEKQIIGQQINYFIPVSSMLNKN